MSEALIRAGLWALRLASLLPFTVLARLGDVAGLVAWALARPRRLIARTNLQLCFPDLSAGERARIERRHFRMFARSFLDRFILWHGSADRIRELCRLEAYHYLEAPLRAGRPVIVLAPHFVGIDAGGIRLMVERPGVGSMYARQKSAALNEVMTRGRSRFESTMMLRNDGLRPAVRLLQSGGVFYFLPDMDLGARDALFVPFFGVPAATVTSVARLARLTGAAVVPMVTQLGEAGYVSRFYPAWEDYPGADLEAATRALNAFIEARVLEMPDQYLWTHRRFKTRPPGAPVLYRGIGE